MSVNGKIGILGVIAVALVAAAFSAADGAGTMNNKLATDAPIGNLEIVHEFFDDMPTGVTVAKDGRIFVNFPQWGDTVPFTVGEVRGDKVVAYPDVAINTFDPKHPDKTLSSVQSVVMGPDGLLWILDTAAPGFGRPQQGAVKLIAVDISTNKVAKTVVLPESVVLPTTYVNDVRFDFRAGKPKLAYITDSSASGPGGIIIVNLDNGHAWRRLSGHPSTSPDPVYIPVVEGERLAVREQGKKPAPFMAASDGIALSADGETLFYCPLSSRHLFSVPTRLLQDPATPEAMIASAVQDLGEKGASDGLEADDRGHIYAGDYERNSIRQRSTSGEWVTVAHDPRILWPDTMSMAADGYLYFTTNQLHRAAQFHEGIDQRQKPYVLFKIKVGGGPVLLK